MPRPARFYPPSDLRHFLAEARARGLNFEDAWNVPWPRIRYSADGGDAGAWREALVSTREHWRRAYVGEPPAPSVAAVSQLFTVRAGAGATTLDPRALEPPPALAAA